MKETIKEYGIVMEDVYNMDEAGFQMGVTSTAKVVCGFETKQSHAKSFSWENFITLEKSGKFLLLIQYYKNKH